MWTAPNYTEKTPVHKKTNTEDSTRNNSSWIQVHDKLQVYMSYSRCAKSFCILPDAFAHYCAHFILALLAAFKGEINYKMLSKETFFNLA